MTQGGSDGRALDALYKGKSFNSHSVQLFLWRAKSYTTVQWPSAKVKALAESGQRVFESQWSCSKALAPPPSLPPHQKCCCCSACY